jgi:hypothetical protein
MTTSFSKDATEKITISLPQSLATRFKAQVPARQRSTFIAKILEEQLALKEQLEALNETAGCWSDERHQDMVADEDIDVWLTHLREGWSSNQGGR